IESIQDQALRAQSGGITGAQWLSALRAVWHLNHCGRPYFTSFAPGSVTFGALLPYSGQVRRTDWPPDQTNFRSSYEDDDNVQDLCADGSDDCDHHACLAGGGTAASTPQGNFPREGHYWRVHDHHQWRWTRDASGKLLADPGNFFQHA